MAGEVKSITSESLEAAYRALTPSQSGFTQDLQASNTIIPILDLTADAQGTSTPEYLQTAIAFGSNTAFAANNATVSGPASPGFYRFVGGIGMGVANGATGQVNFAMTDGLSVKNVYSLRIGGSGGDQNASVNFDFVVFLKAGESIDIISNLSGCIVAGSYRQVADVNGVLINPSGFTPQ